MQGLKCLRCLPLLSQAHQQEAGTEAKHWDLNMSFPYEVSAALHAASLTCTLADYLLTNSLCTN